MKNLFICIPNNLYEKLQMEAIEQLTTVSAVIKERLFMKKFSDEIEAAVDDEIERALYRILEEE